MGNALALAPARWGVTPAAEVLRPGLRDIALPKWVRDGFDILLMAGSKTDFLEEKMKNLILGSVAYSVPGTVHFGLWAAASLSDTSTSATAGELSGGGYARVAVTNNTTNFASVTTGAKVNSTAITWAVASGSQGTAGQVGVAAVASGAGDLLLWADLAVAKAITSGDTAQFAASDFSWTED